MAFKRWASSKALLLNNRNRAAHDTQSNKTARARELEGRIYEAFVHSLDRGVEIAGHVAEANLRAPHRFRAR